jgi:hypothetical protein
MSNRFRHNVSLRSTVLRASAPFRFFAAIDAAVFAVVLGAHALRVDDAEARVRASAVLFRPCRFKSSNARSHTPFCSSGGDGRTPLSNGENREAIVAIGRPV